MFFLNVNIEEKLSKPFLFEFEKKLMKKNYCSSRKEEKIFQVFSTIFPVNLFEPQAHLKKNVIIIINLFNFESIFHDLLGFGIKI